MTVDNFLLDVSDIQLEYESGRLIGAIIDDPLLSDTLRRQARYETDEVFATIDAHGDFSAIVGSSKGKLCTPWKQYIKSDPDNALKGAQGTGDCVSWGGRTASDTTRCWEIWTKGDEQYIKRQATCLIYSGRGHNGQGASPAKLSKWHINTGYLLEILFTDADGKVWDFTDYKKYMRIGMNNGRNGLPDAIIDITKQHRLQRTVNLTEMDAIADALFNGYGVHCGSSIGVSKVGDPISNLRGSWAHDMAIVGFDDRPETHEKYGSRIWMWDNSWGNWNTVTNIPTEWQPWGQGMFALNENDTWRAVRSGGCWCFSDSDGFPARPYDNLLI